MPAGAASAAAPFENMKMKRPFKFIDPGRLRDGDLELILTGKHPEDSVKKYSPYYKFEMRHTTTLQCMGSIRLRIGSARILRYPGHIGYEVHEKYRGHRYAARSCRLLLPLALAHGLKSVWLTVDPENFASLKTCDIIGARFAETVRIPKEHEMYRMGARYRRRYRIDLKRTLSNNRPLRLRVAVERNR